MAHQEVSQATREETSPLTQCINDSTTIQVNKGEILFWPEDVANSAYYVNSGVIKICRYTEDGQEVIVDLVRVGQFIALESCMSDEPYGYCAETVSSNASLSVIKGQCIKKIIAQSPDVVGEILKLSNKHLERMFDQVEMLKSQSGTQRVASLFAKTGFDQSKNWGDHFQCDKHLYAKFLGLQPESFSRSMRKLAS